MWNKMLDQFCLPIGDPLLYQFILEQMFRNLTIRREQSASETSEKNVNNSEALKLDRLEENAFRYVAGYIPVAFQRKVMASSNTNKSLIISVISKWRSKETGNTLSISLDQSSKLLWINEAQPIGSTFIL
jgi:hypothetical protein